MFLLLSVIYEDNFFRAPSFFTLQKYIIMLWELEYNEFLLLTQPSMLSIQTFQEGLAVIFLMWRNLSGLTFIALIALLSKLI